MRYAIAVKRFPSGCKPCDYVKALAFAETESELPGVAEMYASRKAIDSGYDGREISTIEATPLLACAIRKKGLDGVFVQWHYRKPTWKRPAIAGFAMFDYFDDNAID